MVTINTQSGPHTPGSAWEYWLRRLFPTPNLTPFRIALVYTVAGTLGLFISDVLFVQWFTEPLLSQIQAAKGGVEVLLTAAFIYVVVTGREIQLQDHRERIEYQREELQLLHRVLRHNLRNDLTVIRGYAELIRTQLAADQLTEECSVILETVDELIQYTEQANRLNRVTESNGEIQTHDLTELIPQLLDDHPQLTSDIDVSVDLPETAVVETNRMFREALRELLTNAIKHNDAATPSVTIEVDPESDPSPLIEIQIADNGPGMPASELTPLQTGKEEALHHPQGMGLRFVQATIRHSGGELRFETTGQAGTTVLIRVPKAPEMLSEDLPVSHQYLLCVKQFLR